MKRRKYWIVMRLVLVAVALVWGGVPGNGQNGNGKGNSNAGCTVNGKTYNNCPPGLVKHAKRIAARSTAAAQKKGVKARFAGVSPATATLSPFAAGPTALAVLAPGTVPDYFGVPNYANSPFLQIDATGNIVPNTGIKKFKDALPGLCAVSGPTLTLGQCIPLATPDTTVPTFAGSDFYRIGLNEYTKQMHSDLPATSLQGYFDAVADPTGTQHQYLGPMILATKDRPVRVLFQNKLTANLNVPVDTTYMGAGTVSDGPNSALSSQKRAVLHLHGGNTPWISDGTPHQWTTPAGGDGQPLASGFQKGVSFQNVPDMPGALGFTPSLSDGQGTYFWTNQQTGRLMFYHEHAYGTTRLGVYAGAAAGYLLVDPVQEAALQAATVPGTIVTNPATGAIVSSDLPHVLPLVIQDKTFVPDIVNQLPAQDPTWDLAKWGGPGSLWFPHVYTPNQNPADLSGANGFGRWDWGPWFFPPQSAAGLVLPDYACSSAATPAAGWAFPPLKCPGVPDPTRPAPSNSPSGVPEGFMDTPVVNGTAYPTLTVAPAAYRFQVLNASNDRTLNLGLYVAEPVTLSVVVTNPGSGYTAPTVTIGGCTGGTAIAAVGDGTFGVTPFIAGITGVTMTAQPSACAAPTVTIADTAPGVGSGATASVIMSTNTEVKMVPAVAAVARPATLPNCSTSAASQPKMAGGGLVTALLDASGKPLNGTGLPAGCWPLYFSPQGFTAGPYGPLSWGNTDSRAGGVPDPTTAGPPIVQIGAEGGLLPQAAVIPSTPVSYDYNKRSITVLNILNHGLLLGPAERADIIVDFSDPKWAGKTLILYNDAPAPVPGADPRLDYFTNDDDNSATGGAPSTVAGYGPNIRTVMQIQVTGTNPNTVPFNLATLMNPNPAAVPAGLPSIFAITQDPVIVPEPVYPVANGNGPANYMRIQDNTFTAFIGGPIGGVTLVGGGAGYTAAPAVTIGVPACVPGPGCVAATATATLVPRGVSTIGVTNGGSGYTSAPAVAFAGGGGSGAAASAALAATGSVKTIAVTNRGAGYSIAPTVTITGSGSGATATASIKGGKVSAVTVTNGGSGYATAPTIAFSGSGTGAAATATLGRAVASVSVTNPGSGYTSAPAVSFSGGAGTLAAATATLLPGVVNNITVTNAGSGYTSAPAVTLTVSPLGAASTATAAAFAPTMPLVDKTIQELFTLDYGRMNATLGVELPFTNFLTQTTIPYGYVDPPTEIFKDGETQFWKITHNGVDTHFIHFHLFTVQVINRVGWDGAIKPPDPNEVGFKDTVRMNPLEDIVIALRPFKQTVPWPVPSSIRAMDVTRPVGSSVPNEFTNVDPTNQPATVTNQKINFGWEYVWHCHILGHEENDMMRAMVLAVAPNAPANPAATLGGTTKSPSISLSLSSVTGVANYANPTGFTIQRAVVTGGVPGAWTTLGSVPAALVGNTATATFTDSTVARRTSYVYRAFANNLVGYTQTYAAPAVGYPHVSADSTPSGASNTITTN
jgi:FtsP/CotA-like multicopper oxidase with cupredoxin domain